MSSVTALEQDTDELRGMLEAMEATLSAAVAGTATRAERGGQELLEIKAERDVQSGMLARISEELKAAAISDRLADIEAACAIHARAAHHSPESARASTTARPPACPPARPPACIYAKPAMRARSGWIADDGDT